MKAKSIAPKNVDTYIAGFPKDVQSKLQKIRATIRQAAPDAQEKISYQIPTIALNGVYLIYFAAFKKHIAVYPVPSGDAKFNNEVVSFRSGKGTLRFPLDEPIPYGLIRKIVKFRIKEISAQAKPNPKAKKKPA